MIKKIVYIIILFTICACGEEWRVYNQDNSPLPGNHVYSIAIDRLERKWFGTDSGLACLSGDGWQVFTAKNSALPFGVIWTVTAGEGEEIWIGTDNSGVARYDGREWNVWNSTNSVLPNDGIYDIQIDADGNKWFATWGGGLVRYDDEIMTVWNASNTILDHNKITSLFIENEQMLWVGTATGLYLFDGAEEWTLIRSFAPQKANPLGGPGNDAVYEIAMDSRRRLWIGLKYGGVWLYDHSAWRFYSTVNSPLPNDRIYAIAIEDEQKWFGTLNGLVVYDNLDWKVYNTENSLLPDTRIYSIAIDAEGAKWIGTMNAGVAVLQSHGPSAVVRRDHKQSHHLTIDANYPNPFNSSTLIPFQLSRSGHLTVDIYNIRGYHVKTLMSRFFQSGTHLLNVEGNGLSSGVYLIRFQIGNVSKISGCLYLK
jgi:ligand-binding sensor domain-containing protein